MIGQLRLLVFYVYLAGDTLVAVLYGRSTFRHLNALHPRTWYVAQGIRSRRSPEIGNILGHHLDVCSRKSEQLDLFGACCSITVGYIHRRIGCETLSKITTCSFGQFVAGDSCRIHQSPAFYGARSCRDDFHFL